MLPTDVSFQTLPTTLPTRSDVSAKQPDELQKVAQEFEAAFIAQMLTHSGLSEALTSGEGKMAAAFGSFYIEQLANKMADAGGLGMADSIYGQLERYASDEVDASIDPRSSSDLSQGDLP